jgi:iron complex outermembrane receptor protein
MFKQLVAGLALVAAACSSNPAPETFTVAPDDQVSTGYGTQDRSSFAGAANSITREDLKGQEGRRLEDLIRSRVPGAQIVRTQHGFTIRLRGPSSLMGSNDALIVLDGVPLQESGTDLVLASLQPNDIERIDVLKDAAASIYGMRGANGVVIIETRGGTR